MNQTELYLMMTVTGRDRLADFVMLYRDKGVDVHVICLGYGTANQEILKYLALDSMEKAVCLSVVTGRKWREIKRALSVRLRIEGPGAGEASASSLSASEPDSEPKGLADPGLSSSPPPPGPALPGQLPPASLEARARGDPEKDSPSPFSEPEPGRTSGDDVPGPESAPSGDKGFPGCGCGLPGRPA